MHCRTVPTPMGSHQFTCGKIDIDYCMEYKYLGMWLNEHLNYKKTVAEICKAANRAFGVVMAKLYNPYSHQ